MTAATVVVIARFISNLRQKSPYSSIFQLIWCNGAIGNNGSGDIHLKDGRHAVYGAAAYQRSKFRPFSRLDAARNRDEGGRGLGLAIALDIARSHGGDITLGDSKAGGLRATVRVPV
jgi:hypothetical protein